MLFDVLSVDNKEHLELPPPHEAEYSRALGTVALVVACIPFGLVILADLSHVFKHVSQLLRAHM